MEKSRQVMKQMIEISEDELNDFLSKAITKTFNRQKTVSLPMGGMTKHQGN